MTDNDTLADNNIKHFGELLSNQVSCYVECLECGNDHIFRGNIIDLLSDIFNENRNSGISATIELLLKYVDHIRSFHLYRRTGILQVVLAGRVVITDEIIEAMKESGCILKIFYNSVDPESIDSGSLGDFLCDIKDEDDVPSYIHTTLLLKDTEPPLENGGKNDIQALVTEPLKTEFEALIRDEACSSCNVNTGEDDAGGR